MTKPKKIYENQILIGSMAEMESLTLTSSLDYAKTLNEKGPVVTSDTLSLQDLFKFYRESFPALKLTVATKANAEALEALESGVSVLFDGGDRIDVRGKDGKQMALSKLRFASVDNITEYSRKAIRELLTDYPFIREPDAVTAVCDASPLADPAMLTGYAEWFIKKISDRVTGTVSITDNEKATVYRADDNDAVNFVFVKEPSKSISLKPFTLTPQVIRKACGNELVEDILKSGGNYIHRGSQGSGKTELARKLVRRITENERYKAVIVTHRRTIADSCMNGVSGVVHYEQVQPGVEMSMRALVICANSLIRPNLVDFLRKVDVVIVEEADQTLRHIASGTVDRRAEVLSKLNELVAHARINLLLGADSNTKVLRLIRDNKPKDAVVNILEKNIDFSGITIDLNRYKQAEGMIEGILNEGPIAIATDSKRKVASLNAKIRKDFPGFKEKEVDGKTVPAKRKMLTVHSDNILGKDQHAFIKAPNSEADSIDALIYSPAITSSLSITNQRFENHVGLFSGVVTASDAVQMLRRNRPCAHFTVGVRNPDQYRPDTADQILSGATSVTEFDRWAAEIEADDNFVRNHFQAALYIIAKHYGFNVVIADERQKDIENGKHWDLSGRILESREAKHELLNAHAADHNAVNKRTENAGETDQKTAWSIERARIERTVCKSELNEDDIKAWGRGALASHISNLEILRSEEKDAKRLDKKDSKGAFRDKRRIVEHRNAYRVIFNGLGLDLFDGTGEYTVKEANQLLEQLQGYRNHFNSLSLKTTVGKGEIKQGTSKVNRLLGEFGLEVTCKDGDKNNGRLRKYSICPKSWKRMNEYLNNRLKHRMALVKPERIEDQNSKFKPTAVEVQPITQEELTATVAERSAESKTVIKLDAWKKAQQFFMPTAAEGMDKLTAMMKLGKNAQSLPNELKTAISTDHKFTFRQAEITKLEAFGTVHARLFELPESQKQKMAKEISEQYEKDQLIPF